MTLLIAISTVPLLAFGVVAVHELRSQSTLPAKLRNLIPIIAGAAVAIFLIATPTLMDVVGTDEFNTLSNVMTVVSAIIACSGLVVRYSRWSSALWVASGGFILACFWMLNRIRA